MAKIVVHSIIIRSNGYDPSVLDIPVGDHVLWKNEDGKALNLANLLI
jgi:plastocyanin